LDWLKGLRAQALQRFTEQGGFPSQRDEDWKYTDLSPVAARALAFLDESPERPATKPAGSQLAGLEQAITVHFSNGRLGELPGTVAGLRLSAFADIPAQQQKAVLDELTASRPRAGLTDLNTAFQSAGLLIELADGVELSAPLLLHFHSDGQALGQPLVLLRQGRNSRLRLIQHHSGQGPASSNSLLLANCGEASRLDFLRIQDESSEAHHLATQQLHLARDAQLHATFIDLGARLARNDMQVSLADRGANAKLHGLFIANGESHIDYHTRLDHQAKDTHSHEIIRGIAGDRGRGVFNGKIIVHQGADGTDAEMANRNLLLSPRAEIDTKPELEIYADDVKCAHGATTGQLDNTALFYLRSRGIDNESARRILISAFAAEVIESIQPPELRTQLSGRLAERLGAEAVGLPS
jgi:Fe-S cluster assembly protein SufD